MVLVLDSNEYIFAFGLSKESSSQLLLNIILDESDKHTLRVPRVIIEEVRRNLSLEAFREFTNFINNLTNIDEDFLVPFEVGVKYELRHLKTADAFIVAYTEWVGAEILVTENRHFLTIHTELPFRILSAKECINLLNIKK